MHFKTCKVKQENFGTSAWAICSSAISCVTVTDALRLPYYTPVLRLFRLVRWYILNLLKTLSAPVRWSGCTPSEEPRKVVQEGMFWELVPEDVIGKPAELRSAGVEREWSR